MFDPEKFGQAMGDAIRKAVEPLQARIAELEKQLAAPITIDEQAVHDVVNAAVSRIPAPKDGKDCDMDAVRSMVDRAVKALPLPTNGLDGRDGKDGEPGKNGADGKSVTVEDVEPLIAAQVAKAFESVKIPKDGEKGKDGADGRDGEDGADGAGIADLLVDRDGVLVATFTDGRMKSLGQVVGKDGRNGADGQDGLGLESFELQYLDETHEICLTASAAGKTKSIKFPAGGIRGMGYWRDGNTAKAGEAWTHDGSLWIAKKETRTKPETSADGDWVLAARKGRDGERGVKGKDGAAPSTIKLKD